MGTSKKITVRARLQSFIQIIRGAFDRLGSPIPPSEAETIAFAVLNSMETAGRQFHNLNHVLGFLPDPDPIFELCAVFHDVVYVNVDGGWPKALESAMADLVDEPRPGAVLKPNAAIPFYEDILAVFGLSIGSPLLARGLNEVLSALVASRYAGKRLTRKTAIELAACIEGSIAFRESSAFDSLAERIRAAGLGEAETKTAVERAVRFANRDVADFRAVDPTAFLNNTWKLLPELNPALRLGTSYSIGEYRKALEGMSIFFRSLEPGKVFHAWGGEPGNEVFAEWISRTTENLRIAQEYLGAKLLSACFLEAVALVTGGDVPLSFFMGDPVASREKGVRIENLLLFSDDCCAGSLVLKELLESGRRHETGFDIKNSPLAFFFLNKLSERDFAAAVEAAGAFAEGRAQPKEFLGKMPADARGPLLKACAAFAPTRSSAIEELERALS